MDGQKVETNHVVDSEEKMEKLEQMYGELFEF